MAYYDKIIALDAPVAWWPLTDAAGASTLVDSSGGGHAATNHSLVLGQSNSPIVGDTTALNSGNYAQSTYLPNGLTAASGEAWTYISTAGTVEYALSSGINATNDGIGIYFDTRTGALTSLARFGVGTTLGNPAHANTVVLNTWQYWAYSWDGAHLTSYLNGVQLGAAVALSGTMVAAGNTYLGSQSLQVNTLAGNFAQVAIYNIALSPAQVANHYQAAINPPGGVNASSGAGATPYWARRVAEPHFANKARTLGTMGR